MSYTQNISSLSQIQSIQWNTTISEFCEGKIYGQPEILNCFSCFFISYIPYLGMKYSLFSNSLIKNIMSLLFITGFTSFGYHWNGYFLFKYLDEIPMAVSVWFGIFYINQLTINQDIINYFANAYFIFMLSINSIPSLNYIFPIMFLLACLSLSPFIMYYFTIIKKNTFSTVERNEAFTLAKKGMYIATSSGILWFIIEKLCNPFFIFGHAIWHIGITLGMFDIITAIEYFELIDKSHEKKHYYYITYFYTYIPIITQQPYHSI